MQIDTGKIVKNNWKNAFGFDIIEKITNGG